MTAISVTATATAYTVTVTDGPGNPTDWVGVYVVGAANNADLDWQYLNGLHTPPTAGLTSATLTFTAQVGAGPFEVRMFPSNGHNPVLASAPIPTTTTAPPSPDGYINVLSFATPPTDASIRLAIAACKAGSTGAFDLPGLYFPPGYNYPINAQLDLSDIRMIKAEGWIVVNYTPLTGPAIICRALSSDVGGRIFFRGIIGGNYDTLAQPMLQISGFHGADISVQYCQYVQILGDRTNATYASCAYNTFNWGQVFRTEIVDNVRAGTAFAWVNENTFRGGYNAHLRVGGAWQANTALANNGAGLIRVTCPNHGYVTGNMVELYNSSAPVPPAGTIMALVTVIDANRFDMQGTVYAGPYTLSGQSMGPPSYPHNHNTFYSPDIEADVIVHMQGISNKLLGCRMEAQFGSIVAFAPGTIGNVVEQSSMAQHGQTPDVGDPIDGHVTVIDHGTNYTGWMHVPKVWAA